MSEPVPQWISKPLSYLTAEEMQTNVNIIAPYFQSTDRAVIWTKNAIAAMLGNMEVESSINPGIWQGREYPADPYTTAKGFGLLQWSPARKLIQWADGEELDYTDGYTQLKRIEYELTGAYIQWVPQPPDYMTFDEFTQSTLSPEDLAEEFCLSYVRPGDPDIQLRRSNARKWYTFIGGIPPIWLLFKMKQRRLGR